MQKMLTILTMFIVTLPTIISAQEANFFPLDQGMTWFYDNKNIDRIVAIRRITLPEKLTVNVFTFDTYNHEKRMFFRIDRKVYEWRNDNYRLWYDFGANAGDSWKLEWIPIRIEKLSPGNREDIGTISISGQNLNDMNAGAVVTLMETGLTVETPMGEFKNVYRFRTSREGVADASYVDEWFAPGVGCVMRVWDTIAGPKQQRLVKIVKPVPELMYRMDVRLDKEIYREGENIEIEVTLLNWSDKEITLEFPTSLQVDYFIDDVYTWSKNRGFTEAHTTVVIPARDVHKWTFTHTPEDYAIPPGKHHIAAGVVGTEPRAAQSFLVIAERPPLPEGIKLTVVTGKETYAPGEFIDFTLTTTNTTQSDITLNVLENKPVKYTIDQQIPYLELMFSIIPETTEVTIPAGESVTFNGRHSANLFTIKPGDHVLYAGLFGYVGMAKTVFTVSRELIFGIITGNVSAPAIMDGKIDLQNLEPVTGARVTLYPVMPKIREQELEFMPRTEKDLWSTITDDEGSFILDNVPVGSYFNLNVEKDGFYPYNETIRFLAEKNKLNIVLKPKLKVPERPLTFHRHMVKDLLVAFGTGSSVYLPESPFKAFLSVTNKGTDTVIFTFDSENYVEWFIADHKNNVIWSSSEENSEAGKNTAEYTITLEPGDTREFVREGTFKDKVPNHASKYIISGVLNFQSSSIENLEKRDVSGAVKVLVIPSEAGVSHLINAQTRSKELVVDLRDKANTVIDMVMKDENIDGELLVSELHENLHKPRDRHRFIKMVEIDADSTIRAGLDSVYIRIYFDPKSFGEDFNPEKLSIAHWRDNPNWDLFESESPVSDENTEWEVLESRIDTVNNFVEAYTKNFSSFGLFEYDPSATAVENKHALPESFVLFQNQPNPFNPVTLIQFNLPQTGNVRVTVYNIMGQEVARLFNGMLPAGTHSVLFDGSSLSSGVYIYRVNGAGFNAAKKMLLLK